MRTTTLILAIAGLALPAAAQPHVMLDVEDIAQDAALPDVTLFAPAPGVEPGPVPAEFVRTRAVTLSPALARLLPGQRVVIQPEDRPETWVVGSVSEPAPNIRIVRLHHSQDPTGYAALLTYDDATAMTLQIASSNTTYRLQFRGNGAYEVWRANWANIPHEGHPAGGMPPEHPDNLHLDPNDDDYRPPYSDRDAGACGGTSRVLDIMMPYTAVARDAIGGTTAMRAECALAVDHANTAYQNSAMSTRLRLVYCNLVTYTESGSQNTDLDRLTNASDGFMDDIPPLRDTLNADMVELVTDTGSGLGWCPSGAPSYNSGNSTGKWTRVAATYTTAHETGHNLGGGHDRANDGACGPSYGVGHLFGPSSAGWCSVIAYPTGTHPRILHYSNPNVTYNGYATGVAIGATNEAFNARVLTDNDNTVEGFEGTRYDIYVDFSHVGFEFGIPAFPYNTMAEGVTNIDTPGTGAGELPTMYITSGTQTYHATISKAMTIIPCGGSVTLN
jgi:hypothetical protein